MLITRGDNMIYYTNDNGYVNYNCDVDSKMCGEQANVYRLVDNPSICLKEYLDDCYIKPRFRECNKHFDNEMFCYFRDEFNHSNFCKLYDLLYDEYQFITNNQLREWGIEHLIGTPLLKAYLHGYLISSKLYKDLHNIINPIDYEQYRKDILKKKLEERAPMRIPIRKDKNLISNTQINKRFIEKLNKKARGEEGDESETELEHIKYRKLKKSLKKGQQQCAQALLSDSRFSKLFSDADYIIDEEEGL